MCLSMCCRWRFVACLTHVCVAAQVVPLCNGMSLRLGRGRRGYEEDTLRRGKKRMKRRGVEQTRQRLHEELGRYEGRQRAKYEEDWTK